MSARSGTRTALREARRVADAVLYEGYVLFPYRSSAAKNRYRWQFGVVVPDGQAGTTEPTSITSQCLLRGHRDARIEVVLRYLHPRRRQVQIAVPGGHQPVEELETPDGLLTSWDEGIEHERAIGPLHLAALLERPHDATITHAAATSVTPVADRPARVIRTDEPVTARLRVAAEGVGGDVVRLTTTVGNTSTPLAPDASREEVLRRSLVGVHLLLVAHGATFASVSDPPVWAQPWTATLTNRHTHPVLAGPKGVDDVVLSAPIVLPDHPAIAPESAGDTFDATEVDELLLLAVQSLTAHEKRRARATDPRAAEVIDRAEHLPPAVMERLHGAIRHRGPTIVEEPRDDEGQDGERRDRLDAELAAFLGCDDAPLDEIAVDSRTLAVGDRVRLRPNRRADAQDLFSAGRTARIARLEQDLEGDLYVGVTLEDDPAAGMHEAAGRFLYFRPDEVESA